MDVVTSPSIDYSYHSIRGNLDSEPVLYWVGVDHKVYQWSKGAYTVYDKYISFHHYSRQQKGNFKLTYDSGTRSVIFQDYLNLIHVIDFILCQGHKVNITDNPVNCVTRVFDKQFFKTAPKQVFTLYDVVQANVEDPETKLKSIVHKIRMFSY